MSNTTDYAVDVMNMEAEAEKIFKIRREKNWHIALLEKVTDMSKLSSEEGMKKVFEAMNQVIEKVNKVSEEHEDFKKRVQWLENNNPTMKKMNQKKREERLAEKKEEVKEE